MRQFLSPEALAMKPYTPGEQPRDQQYTKLNTNESPFPPSPKVVEVVSRAQVGMLNLYSDPTCKVLEDAIAKFYGVEPENVTSGNGSDEVLAFAFAAFFAGKKLLAPDVTYSFYPVYADLFGVDYQTVPLTAKFEVDVDGLMQGCPNPRKSAAWRNTPAKTTPSSWWTRPTQPSPRRMPCPCSASSTMCSSPARSRSPTRWRACASDMPLARPS